MQSLPNDQMSHSYLYFKEVCGSKLYRDLGSQLHFLRLKFIYSEKAPKFCEIFPLLLTTVHTVKSKGKISQNSVAFSEYMNFNWIIRQDFLPSILFQLNRSVSSNANLKDQSFKKHIHFSLQPYGHFLKR